MIFIFLMGGVWFARYTWWNYPYECHVRMLVWDCDEISIALMNVECVHDLLAHNNDNDKDCGDVMWLLDL